VGDYQRLRDLEGQRIELYLLGGRTGEFWIDGPSWSRGTMCIALDLKL